MYLVTCEERLLPSSVPTGSRCVSPRVFINPEPLPEAHFQRQRTYPNHLASASCSKESHQGPSTHANFRAQRAKTTCTTSAWEPVLFCQTLASGTCVQKSTTCPWALSVPLTQLHLTCQLHQCSGYLACLAPLPGCPCAALLVPGPTGSGCKSLTHPGSAGPQHRLEKAECRSCYVQQ